MVFQFWYVVFCREEHAYFLIVVVEWLVGQQAMHNGIAMCCYWCQHFSQGMNMQREVTVQGMSRNIFLGKGVHGQKSSKTTDLGQVAESFCLLKCEIMITHLFCLFRL